MQKNSNSEIFVSTYSRFHKQVCCGQVDNFYLQFILLKRDKLARKFKMFRCKIKLGKLIVGPVGEWCGFCVWFGVNVGSGVTGGGGGRVPPRDFWSGNFCWPIGKKEGRKNGKLVKGKVENWKCKEWKISKWGEDLFFFFFCFSLFKTTKICFPGKKSGKITLPPQKNVPVMPLNVGWWFCHDSLLSISNQIHIYHMEVVIVSFWSPNGFSLFLHFFLPFFSDQKEKCKWLRISNVIVLFFGNKTSKSRSFEKKGYFWPTFHIF